MYDAENCSEESDRAETVINNKVNFPLLSAFWDRKPGAVREAIGVVVICPINCNFERLLPSVTAGTPVRSYSVLVA